MYDKIIIAGKEFYLVPIEEFDKRREMIPNTETTTPAKPIETAVVEPAINDFLSPPAQEVIPLSVDEPMKKKESHVEIIDTTDDIPEATPRDSDYRKRFLSHELGVKDVVQAKGFNPSALKGFIDDPVIKQNTLSDEALKKAKFGFYGKGIEFDHV